MRFLAEEMQAVSKGLEKIVQELSMSENDGSVSENFRKVIMKQMRWKFQNCMRLYFNWFSINIL